MPHSLITLFDILEWTFWLSLMLNKLKTPWSLFFAKEREKLWHQKAVTCIRSAIMHKNNVCVPLQVPTFISQLQIPLWDNPLCWQNLLWGFQKAIIKLDTINCKIVLILQQTLCPSTTIINHAISTIPFQCGRESFNLAYPQNNFRAEEW